MAMRSARALHYVFKVANRKATYDFYTKVLGMTVLRHEEFEEGCKASCNGPYNGRWSKTMIGYGSEDNHFVIELTYNYEIGSYRLGNDYKGIYIESDELLSKLKEQNLGAATSEGWEVKDPDGHAFYVMAGKKSADPVRRVAVHVKNLKESVEFWNDHCGMNLLSENEKSAILTFGNEQCSLELVALPEGAELERGTGFGRIAFACPTALIEPFEKKMKSVNEKYIHTPLVSLDTPGKATVVVVILADPNSHEICFVGDEAFTELSKIDPKADELIKEAIEKDGSDAWFAKKKRTKAEAQ
ncbi:hypothetical protein QR680_010787 [Steinernema hermaphroditum]|uniref:VOC domain-containing protein n=1 Tax=Steinernema hermaphroditum TaxID=289476 RepID=A0AA39IQ48_9BILA|nr:hypothetical protein QR680_010787 [Steinernema hermaphroditum]